MSEAIYASNSSAALTAAAGERLGFKTCTSQRQHCSSSCPFLCHAPALTGHLPQGQDSSVLGTSATGSSFSKPLSTDYGLDSQRQSFPRGFPGAPSPQSSQVQ